jgi:hypothetical protein
MRASGKRILAAGFLAAKSAVACAVYRDGNIEVVLVTKSLPKDFSGDDVDVDPDWPPSVSKSAKLAGH